VTNDTPSPSLDAAPRRSLARWIFLALVLLVIAGFYAFGLNEYFQWDHIRANLNDWKAQAAEHLLLALLVYFLIYVAVTALSLPAASLVSLVGGALFGRWLGTAVVSIASTVGATLAFLGSRYLLRDWVQSRFGHRLAALNRGVEKDGAFYLLTLRLVPLFPFWLINLGMGPTPIRVWTYIWVSWVGMLLGTFLYVNAGTELAKLLATRESPKGLLSPTLLGSLVLLGVAPLVVRKVMQWVSRDGSTGDTSSAS
jgi:uncharacterized membrane protein YdjX (TVP38/TMEM64 family)